MEQLDLFSYVYSFTVWETKPQSLTKQVFSTRKSFNLGMEMKWKWKII